MKAVILAGGLGTRLSEETNLKPKPMVEIGDMPILWHIMKIYSHFGINDFIILVGYKGYLIKEFFANYSLHHSNVTIDLSKNSIQYHNNESEDWKVSIIDTGINTNTGGRIKIARKFIGEEPFLMTYGDGVADVDISELIDFHKKSNKLVTMTAVQPEGRFGSLEIEGDFVRTFIEKPVGDGGWINGGFFVCEPDVFNYIPDGDDVIFEKFPLENLAIDKQLAAYKHIGFWKPMDTLRDKQQLELLLKNGNAKWKKW